MLHRWAATGEGVANATSDWGKGGGCCSAYNRRRHMPYNVGGERGRNSVSAFNVGGERERNSRSGGKGGMVVQDTRFTWSHHLQLFSSKRKRN